MPSPPFTLDLPTRRDTKLLGRRLAAALRPADLVVLTGPLGAGKTFLVRALCRALGLSDRVPVTSPTFTLVNEHQARLPIVHADLYRLRTPREVRDLGLDAMRDEGWVVLVEWGEPFVAVLGGEALVVELSVEPRRAALRAVGSGGEALLERLRSA